MRYIFQDSHQHVKDMMVDVDAYMKANGVKVLCRHLSYRFSLIRDEGNLIIAPRKLTTANYKPFQQFYRVFPIGELDELLGRYDNVFIMVANLPQNLNDHEILSRLDFYHRRADGEFVNCRTGEVVDGDPDKVSCLSLVTAFPLMGLNTTVLILNNEYLTVADDWQDDGENIHSTKHDTLRERFFAPKWQDADMVIGDTVFVSKDEMRLTLLPPDADASILSIVTDLPYRIEDGVMILNTNMPPRSNSYVRVELCVHEFFQQFVYRFQRPVAEYTIYRRG